MRVNCPDPKAPVHELEPVNVPVMAAADAVALPDADELHAALGLSNPPTGTVTVNSSDDPDTVPETVPRPVTPVPVSVVVSEPENDAPDWVSCHVIRPGPDESDAVPAQVPPTLAGATEGAVVLEESPEEHPVDTTRTSETQERSNQTARGPSMATGAILAQRRGALTGRSIMMRAMGVEGNDGLLDTSRQVEHDVERRHRIVFRRWAAALAILCVGAVWLQFRHIEHTLPYPWDIDEPFVSGPAIRTLSTGTLHPITFNYPSLPKYLASIGMAVGFLRGAQAAEIWEIRQIHNTGFPYYDAPRVMQGARQLFSLLSVIALAATGFAAWHAFREPAAALLAPLVLAASPLYFYHSWTYLNVDVVALCFSALTLAACMKATRQPSMARCAVIPGLAAGLATGSKYTQALVILAVLATVILYVRPGRRIAACGAAIAAMVAAFLIAVPYSLIDIPGFLNGVGFEAFHYASGHRGMSAEPGWPQFVYYMEAFVVEFGVAGLATALVGVAAFGLGDPRRAAILVIYPALALWMLVAQRTHFPRNLLSLLPVVALFVAYGVIVIHRAIARAVARRTWRVSTSTGVRVTASALLLVAAVPFWHFPDQLRGHTDSRNEAQAWLQERIPAEWGIVIPAQLRFDARALKAKGARVTEVDLQGAPTGGALNALLGQTPGPAVILVPRWGADSRFPGQDLADTLNRLRGGWQVMKTFGANPVLVNYSEPVPSGDPAFDVAVLDLHRIPSQ